MKTNHQRIKVSTLISATLLSLSCLTLPSLSAHAESNDSLMKKGMWKDPQTGLIWMRCSIGQTWDGSTCTGTPIRLNWHDANNYFKQFNEKDGFANQQDWRLPSIEELSTIRKCSNGWVKDDTGKIKVITIPTTSGGIKQVPNECADGSSQPTIDTHIFPNMKATQYGSYDYWSSSPIANGSNYAWYVSFKHGGDYYIVNIFDGYVRAVRSDD